MTRTNNTDYLALAEKYDADFNPANQRIVIEHGAGVMLTDTTGQAFNMAIDRKTLIEKVMLNDRLVATSYVPTGISEGLPDEKGYAYDPAKAKEWMAKAGFPDVKGFPKIEFVTTADEQSLAEALTPRFRTKFGISTKHISQQIAANLRDEMTFKGY